MCMCAREEQEADIIANHQQTRLLPTLYFRLYIYFSPQRRTTHGTSIVHNQLQRSCFYFKEREERDSPFSWGSWRRQGTEIIKIASHGAIHCVEQSPQSTVLNEDCHTKDILDINWLHCGHYNPKRGTTSIQWARGPSSMCPLFGGFTVFHAKCLYR